MNLPVWFIEITLNKIQEKYKLDKNTEAISVSVLTNLVAKYLGVKECKPNDFLPFPVQDKNKVTTSIQTPDKETLSIFFRLHDQGSIPSDVVNHISRYIPLWRLKECE